MEPKFRFGEIVRIVSRPHHLPETVVGLEGPIVGISENGREYAVHLNEYGESFRFSDDVLEGSGRIRGANDLFVTRSRTVWLRSTSSRCALLKTDDNVRGLLSYVRRLRDKLGRLNDDARAVQEMRLELAEKQLHDWGIDL